LASGFLLGPTLLRSIPARGGLSERGFGRSSILTDCLQRWLLPADAHATTLPWLWPLRILPAARAAARRVAATLFTEDRYGVEMSPLDESLSDEDRPPYLAGRRLDKVGG
jgi:hypothetical protein